MTDAFDTLFHDVDKIKREREAFNQRINEGQIAVITARNFAIVPIFQRVLDYLGISGEIVQPTTVKDEDDYPYLRAGDIQIGITIPGDSNTYSPLRLKTGAKGSDWTNPDNYEIVDVPLQFIHINMLWWNAPDDADKFFRYLSTKDSLYPENRVEDNKVMVFNSIARIKKMIHDYPERAAEYDQKQADKKAKEEAEQAEAERIRWEAADAAAAISRVMGLSPPHVEWFVHAVADEVLHRQNRTVNLDY